MTFVVTRRGNATTFPLDGRPPTRATHFTVDDTEGQFSVCTLLGDAAVVQPVAERIAQLLELWGYIDETELLIHAGDERKP